MTRGKSRDRIPIDVQAVKSRLKQLGLSASDASRQAWLSRGYLYTACHRGYVTGDVLEALQKVLGDGGDTWVKESEEPPDIYYGHPDDEKFRYTTLDEHVFNYLDGLAPNMPETIEVVEYHRVKLQEREWALSGLLDDVLERLDEEYAVEDAFEATDRMKEAASAFEKVIREEYVPNRCEQGGAVITVGVKDWISVHQPWPNWKDYLETKHLGSFCCLPGAE